MEERALVISGIVQPLVTVEEAVEAWKGYLRLCDKLLDKSDYQTIRGRKFRKKSGWRKLARAFNITDHVAEKQILRNERGRVFSAEFTVIATAPNRRQAEGWGSCTIEERAHVDDKTFTNPNGSRWTCSGPCDGRKHFSNPDHDIPATAHTRAKNRGISDLIGAGEVSAEEIEAEDLGREGQPESKAKAPSKRRAKGKAKPKPKGKGNNEHIQRPDNFHASPEDPGAMEWKWLNQELTKAGVSQQEAISCIGHPTVSHWLRAEPGRTISDALDEILAIAGKGEAQANEAEEIPGGKGSRLIDEAEAPPPEAEADLPQPGNIISQERIPL